MANRGSVANLLLRIFSQKGDAKTDVDELAGALETLDHTKAEAKATVDTDKAAFDELQAQLDLFNHKKVDAKVGVDTAGAESQLQLFTHSLENLKSRAFTGKLFSAGDVGQMSQMFPHQGQLTIPVDLDSGKAQAEAIALNEQLSLELHDQHVNVDIDKVGNTEQAISALVGAFGSLSGVGAGVGSALSKVGESMGSVTVNIGMFGLSMGPVLAIVLALASALAISLVSALAAVAASAILAATALAAMGVALVGALAPIALIAIPAVLAFGKVFQALASSQTDQTKAARDAAKATRDKAAADQSARQYAQQHADAERALADATQNAADAQKAAYREMQDAIERVRDALRGLQEAQLGQQQSQLDFDKAKQALKDFREQAGLTGKTFDAMFKTFSDVNFDPSKLNAALKKIKVPGAGGGGLGADDQLKLRQLVLDVKSAKLGEADATDKVHDSEVELTRARQDAAPFLQSGINGSKAYQAALKGVADAQRNLARVESDRAFALKNQAALQAASNTSADAARTKTQRLSAENKKLLAAVKSLIAVFKEAFGPAINAFLDGFIAGFKILEPAIRNLRGPITELGKAMGAAVTDFFKVMASPASQNLFVALINGAKQLLPYVDKIFAPILDILGKIAVAAMPFLVQGFKDVAKFLNDMDKGLTIKNIRDFIRGLIPHLTAWVKLGLALIPSFFKFLIQIAPFGDKLLRWVTGVAIQFGKWVESKKGRDEIHDFFSKTIPTVTTFLGMLVDIAHFFISVTGWISNATNNVIRFFDSWHLGDFLATLLSLVRGDWVDVFITIFKRAGKRIIGALWSGMKSVGVFIKNTILGPPFDSAINFLRGIPRTLRRLGHDAINAIWNGIRSAGFSIKNWIVPKFNAVVDWLKGVPGTLYNLGRRAINGLWNGIRSIAFSIKNFVVDKLNALLNLGKWLADRMFDIGKNMAQGIWNGLRSIAFSVKDWVSGKVDGALSFLGIKSPSKLMMEMGKNVGIGFEVGINATNKRVTNAAMRTLAQPVAAAAGAAGAAGRSAGVTIHHQDVNLPAAPGHDQMGDPRHQAALFAREMRRRGWR